MHDVFISYASENLAVAEEICRTLEAEGIPCWYAPRNINPGDKWTESIVQAIVDAKVFVILFSKDSNMSPHVQSEIAHAHSSGCSIIPYRIDHSEMTDMVSYYLGPLHWLDTVSVSREESLRMLYLQVRKVLGASIEDDPILRKIKLKKIVKRFLIIFLVILLLLGGGWLFTARKKKSENDILQYAQSRIVLVETVGRNDYESCFLGFFIDDKGTFVTNYSCICYSKEIEITTVDGQRYDVKRIVQFDEALDIAVLQADIKGNDYFSICKEVTNQEKMYAFYVNLFLQEEELVWDNFYTQTVTVNDAGYTIGEVPCIALDSLLPEAFQGGPLVNEYGEVAGLNYFGDYTDLSIPLSVLETLGNEENMTMTQYVEWWDKQSAHSYTKWAISDENVRMLYSNINTYDYITGTECVLSADYLFSDEEEMIIDDHVRGYNDGYLYNFYPYEKEIYESYIEYLHSIGYVYDMELSNLSYNDAEEYYYYHPATDTYISLVITNKNFWLSEYGRFVIISVSDASIFESVE